MPLRIFLLLLLVLPVADIWSLGWVIEEAGLGPTLLAIVAAGLVGFSAARLGAALAFRQLTGVGIESPSASGAAESGGDLLREGLLLWVAAGLLLFPGVVSDVVALPVLIPPVRRWIAPRLLARLAIQSHPGGVGLGTPLGGVRSDPRGDAAGADDLAGARRTRSSRVRVGESKPTTPPRRPNPFSTPFD